MLFFLVHNLLTKRDESFRRKAGVKLAGCTAMLSYWRSGDGGMFVMPEYPMLEPDKAMTVVCAKPPHPPLIPKHHTPFLFKQLIACSIVVDIILLTLFLVLGFGHYEKARDEKAREDGKEKAQ